MLVFGRSAVVMALPCCPSREPHAPTWGAPGLSRGRFLSLEGRGVVPGGFRSGVRWIQETGQVVNDRLENLYQALETKQLPIEALSPRILSLKSRQDQLTAAREEAESQLEQRRAELPTSKEIKGYVADFREFLQEGTFPERKALIRNFVQGIEIVENEAVLTYTIPMPQDGVTSESASVLDFVQSGPPDWTKSRTFTIAFTLAL